MNSALTSPAVYRGLSFDIEFIYYSLYLWNTFSVQDTQLGWKYNDQEKYVTCPQGIYT